MALKLFHIKRTLRLTTQPHLRRVLDSVIVTYGWNYSGEPFLEPPQGFLAVPGPHFDNHCYIVYTQFLNDWAQMTVCFQWCLVGASSRKINISALKISEKSNAAKNNKQWIIAAQKNSCQHVRCVTSTEVEMVRPSRCVSGRVWGHRKCKFKVFLQLHDYQWQSWRMASCSRWYINAGDAPSPVKSVLLSSG